MREPQKRLLNRRTPVFNIGTASRLAGIPRPVVERSRTILAELESNFARESHTPQLTGKRGKKKPRQADDGQMSLFGDLPPGFVQDLAEVDLEQMTPIDAMNKLKQLRDKYGRPES